MGRDEEDEALLDVVDDPAALAPARTSASRTSRRRGRGRRPRGRPPCRCPSPRRRRRRGAPGASFTPSPVTATIRCSGRAARDEPRASGPGVERATTWRSPSSAASRASSQAASSSPVTMRSASSPASRGDRRGRERVVAGDDDDLDARRLRAVVIASADAVADRVGEADEGPELPRVRRRRAGRGRRAARRPRPTPRSARAQRCDRGRVAADPAPSTTSGAPSASSSIDPSGRRARVRVTGSAARRPARRRPGRGRRGAASPPSASTAARSDRVNEPGATPSPGPRVLLGAQGLRRGAPAGRAASSTGPSGVRTDDDVEPVAGERARSCRSRSGRPRRASPRR